jgi:hypothetical protein
MFNGEKVYSLTHLHAHSLNIKHPSLNIHITIDLNKRYLSLLKRLRLHILLLVLLLLGALPLFSQEYEVQVNKGRSATIKKFK